MKICPITTLPFFWSVMDEQLCSCIMKRSKIRLIPSSKAKTRNKLIVVSNISMDALQGWKNSTILSNEVNIRSTVLLDP